MIPDWAGYCEFRDKFAEVIDARYFPMEWLDQRILDGRAHFFRSEHAALIVELRLYPGGAKDLHALIAAGDRDEIIGEIAPQAEAFGRENGCTAAVVESREGWKRALARSGYQPHQLSLRKELADGPQ